MLPSYQNILQEYIKFKSISTDPKYSKDIKATADYLNSLLSDIGMKVQVFEQYGNPIVYAEYIHNADLETALVYGHYDVQPANQSEGWDEDPFTLHVTDDKFVGRGTTDNKGQHLIHIVAVMEAIKAKTLKYNVKFLIEGEEESGSSGLERFVEENLELIKADFFVCSDGEMRAENPTMVGSFRGIFNAGITIKSSVRDLHSGIYGGAVPNSAYEAADLISKLWDDENLMINVPGFYDDVEEPSQEVVEFIKSQELSDEEFLVNSGTKAYFQGKHSSAGVQTSFYPTMEVTGINSGYTGNGFRNSVPRETMIKLNFRLSPTQDAKRVSEAFVKWVADNLPDYLDHSVETESIDSGVLIDSNNMHFVNAQRLQEKVYGHKSLKVYQGAIIPLATIINEKLRIPQLYVDMANPDCNMHAVGENIRIDNVKKGLEFAKEFWG